MFLLLMRLMIIIFYMSRVFGNVIFDLIKSKILENEEGKAETLAQTSLFTKAKYKNVALETIDSTEIFAWFVTPAEVNEQTQIVLVLHGNNDNRETFCKNYEIENVIDVNNFAFLIVDYRDFGDSKGEFEKDTVVFDVSACLEYLHVELEIDDVDTVAISLGSGILFEYIDSCKLDDKKKDHCLLDKPFSGDVVHSKNTIEKLKSLMTSGGDIKFKAEGKDTARIQRIALVSPIKSIFETVKNMIYLDNLPNIMMGVINKYILTSFAFDNTDKVGYVPKENIKVIHGVKDELISTRQIDEMMEDNPEAVVKIEEGDHASTIKNQTTWSEIFKFFN